VLPRQYEPPLVGLYAPSSSAALLSSVMLGIESEIEFSSLSVDDGMLSLE